MANILQHISLSPFTASRAIQYDEALKLAEQGNTISLLYCDGLMDQCYGNMDGNYSVCAQCKENFRKEKKKFGKKLNFVSMKNLISVEQEQKIENLKFEYETPEDIKSLKYDNIVSIGLAALSSYVSTTRNINPLLDDSFHIYIDKILRNSVRVTEAIKGAIHRIKPEKILLFNGRFTDNRPVWELARMYNIPFESLEAVYGINRNFKVIFTDGIPHSISANNELINTFWDNSEFSLEEKIEIGKSFFIRRRNAQFAGDKIYTARQKKGMLPDGWDKTKHNIVIFNSSEDEFFAIGDEYAQYALFKSQIEGLKFVKELVVENDDVMVTLRIHPNLASVAYSYARDIILLNDKNFRVIPADSEISSYALVDAADTVVVFGSTIGIESVYWNKPTILLAGTPYYYLKGCYIPQTVQEFSELLLTKLVPREIEPALKYGYFMLTEDRETHSMLDYDWQIWNINLLGKHWVLELDNWRKIFGSRKLYTIITAIRIKWKRLFFLLKGLDKRYIIPVKEQIQK